MTMSAWVASRDRERVPHGGEYTAEEVGPWRERRSQLTVCLKLVQDKRIRPRFILPHPPTQTSHSYSCKGIFELFSTEHPRKCISLTTLSLKMGHGRNGALCARPCPGLLMISAAELLEIFSKRRNAHPLPGCFWMRSGWLPAQPAQARMKEWAAPISIVPQCPARAQGGWKLQKGTSVPAAE